MSNWKENKRWSDRFLPEIKQILGMHLIGEPPIEEDQVRNTDLMVLSMAAVRIGCRVRRNKYLKYQDQFTIRSSVPSGKNTELQKVISGWGDYFFYGFCNENETELEKWTLCDMNVFRLDFARMAYNQSIAAKNKSNVDGSSDFMAFNYSDFSNSLIVATKENQCTKH